MRQSWLPDATKANLAQLLSIHMESRLLQTVFGPIYQTTLEEWAACRLLLPDKIEDFHRTPEELAEEMIDLGILNGHPIWWNKTLEPGYESD